MNPRKWIKQIKCDEDEINNYSPGFLHFSSWFFQL
jgi:hypothetical protein